MVLGLLFVALNLQAKEKMIWSIIHWPPLMILQGEDAGKGRFDHFLKLFQAQMPQYEHQTIEMNWNRVWFDIKAGKNVCNIMSLKNAARTEFALFSKPGNVTLSNRIILKQARYEALGKPASLSISELINDPILKGAIESSRSYTQALDKILDEKTEESNMKRYVTNSVQLMKMLVAGRFDYLIEYPFIASYLLKGINKTDAKISSVAIEEIAPYSLSYLACPNTQWGQERIAAYNAALQKLSDDPLYLQAMQTWYATDEERAAVLKGYLEIK
jgi:uncharacterized protein (TIGR02285 family)